MTTGLQSPVPGLRITRMLDSDGAAASLLAVIEAGPQAGRPVVLTVGRRVLLSPGEHAVYQDWAQRLARVSGHPHIVDVVGTGFTADTRPYLVAGTADHTLADTLRTRGARAADDIQAIGTALADALAAAHDAGLVHGAVRPATVLVTGTGPLLAGFDAAAPNLAQALAVSAYTAPEHLTAAAAGNIAASLPGDVYALAATLYAALGGRLPWAADDGSGVTDPALRHTPIAGVPGVSSEFLDVLRGALVGAPHHRPTAAQFRDALAAVPAEAMPESGRAARTGAPVAVALLAGLGARPVADVVASAVTSVTSAASAGAAGVGGAASGVVGTAGYATAASPGIGLSQAVGGTATGAVGGGATVGTGAAAGTGAMAAGGAATGGVGMGGAVAGTGMAGTAAAGIGIGAKIAIAAAVIATVGGGGAAATYYATNGGGSDKPAVIQSPTLDQSIRKTDFKNITYYDDYTEREVTIRDGEHEGDTPDGTTRWNIVNEPVYTDIDDDGDEDAAVTYLVSLGNGFTTSAYVFRWDDGKLKQIRRPFATGGRCGDQVGPITATPQGFAVDMKIRGPNPGDCASGAQVPAPFTVAVKNGYVIRVAPAIGAPEHCVDRDSDIVRSGKFTPRAAPDPKAPTITDNRSFTRVRLHRYPTEELDGRRWHLATLTSEDGTKFCGWVSP